MLEWLHHSPRASLFDHKEIWNGQKCHRREDNIGQLLWKAVRKINGEGFQIKSTFVQIEAALFAGRENLFLVQLRPNAASLHCEHQHSNTFDFLIAWLFWFSFRYTLHIANTVDLVQLSTTDVSNDRGISLPFVSFHLKYKFGCLY